MAYFENMEEACDMSKITMFVPDGANVFGASLAESSIDTADNGPVEGNNVASYWNDWREAQNFNSLETIHCSAHRCSLANKDCANEVTTQWQSLLLKQYFHFQESGASSTAFQDVLKESKCKVEAPQKGSAQKWIGFAEVENQDKGIRE